MATMGGSRMVGMGGSRMGGSIMPTQGSMMMGTQQAFGAPQTNIPGNPSKIILNEDEMMIEGVRFIEKKTLKMMAFSHTSHIQGQLVTQYMKLLQQYKTAYLCNLMSILILKMKKKYI